MGNASALAYDIVDQVEFKGKVNWTLHNGLKKTDREEQRESVSLFRVSKTHNANDLALAQRTIQKLRTLKHPYVLKFIETAEMDDSLALVTEPCVPLETWIAKARLDRSNDAQEKEEVDVKLQEILWGLKCVLLALKFINENCALLHGNLGLHAIFVTPNGDWKLAGLELAGSMAAPADLDHFLKHAHLLDSVYCSPERLQREALTARSPPYYVDVYAFGQCVQRVFAAMDLEMPRSYGKYLTSMLHADMKKRPSAQKLLESALFASEHLAFIESIGELALKEPKEFLDVVAKMEPKVAGLSRAVCAHKILPNLARTLQNAINDFPQRDARESCRQSIQVTINLLSKLAAMNKLDAAVFRQSWVPILVQLWAMSDRTVRTTMLQSLKALVPFIPEAAINKTIFDNILAGFSDSNAKLRESTLMSLIFVVDKLDENQMQDRLVRSVTNLQNDAEASIRTNATIFLGKIAVKLKEPVRVRVLCPAFQKAMKDNFLHCRVAGLRTSNACVKMLDVAQTATKIIPQASILLLDKSAEVRSLALTLIESCLELLRAHHASLVDKARAETGASVGGLGSPGGNSSSSRLHMDSPSTPSSTSKHAAAGGYAADATTASSTQSNSSWSSWSVLQGISKSIESATIVAADGAPPQPHVPQHSSSASHPISALSKGSAPAARIPAAQVSRAAAAGVAEEDEMDFDPDMHDHDDDGSSPRAPSSWEADEDGERGARAGGAKYSTAFDEDEDDIAGPGAASGSGKAASAGKAGGKAAWDAQFDDLDLDDEDQDEAVQGGGRGGGGSGGGKTGGSAALKAGAAVPGGLGLGSKPAVAASAGSGKAPPKGMSLAGGAGSGKAPKVAVTKLSVSKDEGWEDF